MLSEEGGYPLLMRFMLGLRGRGCEGCGGVGCLRGDMGQRRSGVWLILEGGRASVERIRQAELGSIGEDTSRASPTRLLELVYVWSNPYQQRCREFGVEDDTFPVN